MVKINENYHQTKAGVIKKNPIKFDIVGASEEDPFSGYALKILKKYEPKVPTMVIFDGYPMVHVVQTVLIGKHMNDDEATSFAKKKVEEETGDDDWELVGIYNDIPTIDAFEEMQSFV